MAQLIGDFEIVRPLGQGAFGQVLLCKHRASGELRALKVLQGSPQPGTPQHRALQNEIALAPKIVDTNVVRVFGSGFDPAFGEYLIEEFIDGTTLRAFIDSQRTPVPYDEARRLMRGIACGLSAINAIMVHRDVHPGNVLLSGATPKLTDFGLAKLATHATRTETFKGIQHVHYKAPEGWKNEKNSFAMDVYSAGVVFFELFAGAHPYELDRKLVAHEDWRDAHLLSDRPRLRDIRADVPPAISSLISQMMAVAPSDRPSWELVLDVIDHDREVPAWLSLPGEPGRRAHEAAERKRQLVRRFEQEQEYRYRAVCNRFLCELEDLIAEARDHLLGSVTTQKEPPNSLEFILAEKKIICRLFPRLREERVLAVGPVLGGGYLEAREHLFNVVACGVPDDEFGASWWCYPAQNPIKDAAAFYKQLAADESGDLKFVAHAIRGFSWLLHELFVSR